MMVMTEGKMVVYVDPGDLEAAVQHGSLVANRSLPFYTHRHPKGAFHKPLSWINRAKQQLSFITNASFYSGVHISVDGDCLISTFL
jgi:hypothetical protein